MSDSEQDRRETLADIVADIRGRADCAERHGDRETHNDGVAMLMRSIADRIEAVARRAYGEIGSSVCGIDKADSTGVAFVRAALDNTIGGDFTMSENETVMAVCAEWRDCIESADPSVWNDERIAGLVKTTKAQQLAYLARIEAAWRREVASTAEKSSAVGNAAATREAMVKIRRELNVYCNGCTLLDRMTEDPPDYTCLRDSLLEIERIVDAALSAPARNCDRFANELDTQLAFLNEVWLISVDRETMLERDKYENWTDEMRTRYGIWLLATAAERKGECDA